MIGRQCGHIQNDHVLPATALYYLEHFASRFVHWIVAPAVVALRGWSRRAEVTCDRAGLLCTRDLDVSAAALRQEPASAPSTIEALRVFAESEYYRAMLKQPGGMTPEACDERVAEILKGKSGHDRGRGPRAVGAAQMSAISGKHVAIKKELIGALRRDRPSSPTTWA